MSAFRSVSLLVLLAFIGGGTLVECGNIFGWQTTIFNAMVGGGAGAMAVWMMRSRKNA